MGDNYAAQKWRKHPKPKNEPKSLTHWGLVSKRVQRYDVPEVHDWISVRLNQQHSAYIIQQLFQVISVILSENIPFSKPKTTVSLLHPLETPLLLSDWLEHFFVFLQLFMYVSENLYRS